MPSLYSYANHNKVGREVTTLSKKELDPSVEEFKSFVKKHPKLIKHVRNKKESWQPYYEKWVLLGEDDDTWNRFKDEGKSSDEGKKEEKNGESEKNQKDFMKQMMGMVDNVDLDKVQGHINQLSGAMTNIQSLVTQFKEMRNKGQTQPQPNKPNPSPFHFGKD